MKKISLLLFPLIGISACNSGGGSNGSSSNGNTYPANPTNIVGPNNSYQCLPTGLPTSSSADNSTKIAYGSNCEVSDVNDTSLQSSLQSMAVAITNESGSRYCTGTPLSYNAVTGVGYVLSAAHCVVGNPKPAGQQITPNNIVTFAKNENYINQILHAASGSGTTGTIQAIYIPSQYCQSGDFTLDDQGSYSCDDFDEQNGDLALLKVSFASGQSLAVNPQVQLAPSNFTMSEPSYILALGYGVNNYDISSRNKSLYYITYEYFANNTYQGKVGGLSTIMNGYSPQGYNAYYSIICGGDSGGGDFYWDGNNWNLVGAHSYGSSECGSASVRYAGAYDVSADIRPFTSQLKQIMDQDTTPTGCNASVSGFTCNSL